MSPEIYWLKNFSDNHLAIMPKPRANDWLADEIYELRQEGVDILVSLLTEEEIAEIGLRKEAEFCQQNDIEFISFPIPDRAVPNSYIATLQFSKMLLTQIQQKHRVAIHCRAGIGRSSLIAACILVCSGISPKQAYMMISQARGLQVPDTEEQVHWLSEFQQYL